MPKKLSSKEFIERAKDISEYDILDDVNYVNYITKIEITCKKHGKYRIRPSDYLRYHRCPECSHVKRYTKKTFIEKAKQIHGDKYDYSKVEYKNSKTKVCIICPIHGEFWQRPNDHLQGNKCPKCYGTYQLSTEEFIEKVRKVHGDKYDYSKVDYKGAFEKVCIICPEHGEFWQTPLNHANGTCCPKCSKIITHSKMSDTVLKQLQTLPFNIEKEKTFDWLVYKRKLRIDFFITELNIGIEVQGEQHFKPFKKFGGLKEFDAQHQRDIRKKELCEEHGIKLFYITKRNLNIDEIKKYINETTCT